MAHENWVDSADRGDSRNRSRPGPGEREELRAVALLALYEQDPEDKRREALRMVGVVANWVERRHPCGGIGRCVHPDHARDIAAARRIAGALGVLDTLTTDQPDQATACAR